MWTPRTDRRASTANRTVTFPNRSRSYDAVRHVVRFWGYDRSMEMSFFVSADALKHIQPNLQLDEAGALQAFDNNRELIYAAATKAYAGGPKGSYHLDAANF